MVDGMADLAHRLAGWVAPIVAVALILGIPWLLGWMAIAMTR